MGNLMAINRGTGPRPMFSCMRDLNNQFAYLLSQLNSNLRSLGASQDDLVHDCPDMDPTQNRHLTSFPERPFYAEFFLPLRRRRWIIWLLWCWSGIILGLLWSVLYHLSSMMLPSGLSHRPSKRRRENVEPRIHPDNSYARPNLESRATFSAEDRKDAVQCRRGDWKI
ncbi:hypothetical protein B0J13DRAFT_140045 [Dactylonectria estremocensis]|uniref:Uncharacterized protein n=1 Tax=Dactylonectria estremocensis TaxID=1079267 RepID=A0A9P9E094_9HYPO|nr:hypothetical protein B0J13DRAFT_140045 [Dactylonectria estremocensis]